MKNRILVFFIFSVFTTLLITFMFSQTSQIHGQIRLTDEANSDWVDSMPVSMNGQVNKDLSVAWIDNRWHEHFRTSPFGFRANCNWEVSYFFQDPLMAKLCNAIFEKDVETMERLIAAGADVNKVGKEGMTLLYWAYHVDDDPRPFACLLEHGANPNIIARIDAHRWHLLGFPGNAVVHLVATGTYNRHFKNVFEHGGDPNLASENEIFEKRTPFQLLSKSAPDFVERSKFLIEHSAELNARDKNGHTFASVRMKLDAHDESICQVVLFALQADADFLMYFKEDVGYFRLIHFLAEAEPKVNERLAEEQTHYRAVVTWLEGHGESLSEAKADLERWKKWKENGQIDLIEKEHQQRLAAEAAKKSNVESRKQ